MNSEREMLRESVDRLLGDTAPSEVVRSAEGGDWLRTAWKAMVSAGLTKIILDVDRGGGGGSILDAHVVLYELGRHATPLPFAETALLGGWALTQADLTIPDGPITLVIDSSRLEVTRSDSSWVINGSAEDVPWASISEAVVVVDEREEGPLVLSVSTDQLRTDGRTNLAGEPRERVEFERTVVSDGEWAWAPGHVTGDALLARGALARASMMAGAMERITEISIRYASEREQFGRPIASFQAVQHHLVAIASETARTSVAAEAGLTAYEDRPDASVFEVACAKAVAADAALVVVARSHQLHGAIGMTAEYDLQLFTRRLHSWRDEYGTSSFWRERIAQVVADNGPDKLWPAISGSHTSHSFR